jgi:hypothetical protein
VSFGGLPVSLPATDAALVQLTDIAALIDRMEPRMRRRWLGLIDASKDLATLEEIAGLVEVGRIDDALIITNDVAEGFMTSLEQVYASVGLSSAAVLRSQVDTLFDFSTLNARSVATLERERLRLVADFSRDQRAATQTILGDAFERGLAPIEQARALKGSIGLTQKQAQHVVNFRRQLERGTSGAINQALRRQLRDRRFDGTLRAVARGDRILTPAQIDRMVERYGERYVQFRANVIARTETVAAIHAGEQEMWIQAVESGAVRPEDVTSTWRTAADERVRASHNAMNGQKRPLGEPFRSGNGNSLRFPGDPLGPASDTVNCRCVVARQLKRAARNRRAVDPLPTPPRFVEAA